MWTNTKPWHIAFRARDRQVITCFLIDSDKILAGSDNAKQKVYDTKTGALRATLEDHEGGIWGLEYHGKSLGRLITLSEYGILRELSAPRCFKRHTSTVRNLQVVLPVELNQHKCGTPVMMPEPPLIISGSRDSSLRVWKLSQPDDPKNLSPGHTQSNEGCPRIMRVLAGHQNSRACNCTLRGYPGQRQLRLRCTSLGDIYWRFTASVETA